ncbi:MAG: hypothetical protein GX660_21800, partial [Clostridiaceae bacterium]|nr:hypothetical protein [Clostridiaceae bacterium]
MPGRKSNYIFLLLLIFTVPALAQRSYTHELTVGMSPESPGYVESINYTNINAAIVAMKSFSDPPLGPGQYGRIKIYPGTYIEQINSRYQNCNNLPKYCDLIGMGEQPEDVVVQHWSQYAQGSFPISIVYAGIYAEGDNRISNLKILNSKPTDENLGFVQNSLEFNGPGVVENCIIESSHAALIAREKLELTGSYLSSLYVYCVQMFNADFYISDSQLIPRQASTNFEYPTGIYASYSSGTINNVQIISSGTYQGSTYSPSLTGIYHCGDSSDYIQVKDSIISLSV